jgi:hypothetical protein
MRQKSGNFGGSFERRISNVTNVTNVTKAKNGHNPR